LLDLCCIRHLWKNVITPQSSDVFTTKHWIIVGHWMGALTNCLDLFELMLFVLLDVSLGETLTLTKASPRGAISITIMCISWTHNQSLTLRYIALHFCTWSNQPRRYGRARSPKVLEINLVYFGVVGCVAVLLRHQQILYLCLVSFISVW
jgi:hypothetical protein